MFTEFDFDKLLGLIEDKI